MSPSSRDTLFAEARDSVSGFRFDEAVASVFPDMLDRSIPGYATIIAQTGLLAAQYARPDTRLYDLGCSLGASACAMQAAIARRAVEGCEIHAIDSSPAMLEAARQNMPATGDGPAVHLFQGDVTQWPLQEASVVAMNFTLQFIAPAARDRLMRSIAEAMVPGGILILSEKVRFDDPLIDAQHTEMYHAFKRANGYSDLEVAQKRAALENVLLPDTLNEHHHRLENAGFAASSVWFQCFNFASLIATRG